MLGQKWRRGQVEMRLANAAISGCAKRPAIAGGAKIGPAPLGDEPRCR